MTGKAGIWMIRVVAVASVVVPAGVDWNHTHLFNEDWPPHARLHDAMSFLMSAGLGAAALYLTTAEKRAWEHALPLAAFLSAWPWVSLLAAGLIPGATYGNTAAGEMPEIGGLPIAPNALLSVVLVVIAIVGWFMTRGKTTDAT